MTALAIANVLGGRKTLKRTVDGDRALTALTRHGLPVQSLMGIADDLAIDRKVLAKVVGISERTLSRRLAGNGRLTAEESDRTVRLARVVAHARDTFGSAKKASLWFQSPNAVLDGHLPMEMLDTDTGARAVDTVLGRIDYGIYS